MASTPNIGLFVPDSDTPISPLAAVFAALQASTDTYLNRKGRAFANATARNAAIPAPAIGDFCSIGSESSFEFQAYDGSTWRSVWSGESTAWVDLLTDSGWQSSGLTITASAGWTIADYNLRKQGSRVHGIVNASRDSSIAFQDNGDIAGGASGDVPAFTLPTGWRNGSPFTTYLLVVRTGNMNMTAANGTNGIVAITHGAPGRTLPANTEVSFYIDHDID